MSNQAWKSLAAILIKRENTHLHLWRRFMGILTSATIMRLDFLGWTHRSTPSSTMDFLNETMTILICQIMFCTFKNRTFATSITIPIGKCQKSGLIFVGNYFLRLVKRYPFSMIYEQLIGWLDCLIFFFFTKFRSLWKFNIVQRFSNSTEVVLFALWQL